MIIIFTLIFTNSKSFAVTVDYQNSNYRTLDTDNVDI